MQQLIEVSYPKLLLGNFDFVQKNQDVSYEQPEKKLDAWK